MKYLIPAGIFGFFLLAYGIFLSQFSLSITTDELKPKNPPGFFDYRGVTNVHTSLKKGSLSAEQIINEAQEAQLDFLFFTDLNYFGAPPIKPGYHDDLLVFWSGAYSYVDTHIINYGRNKKLGFNSLGEVQVRFSDLLSKSHRDEKDGFLVLAHPFKGGENWRGPYPVGLDGIEVINLKSAWREAWVDTRVSFLWSFFVYPFNSHLALMRLFNNPKREIELWDQLNTRRPTIGFVGNETTARTLPIGRSIFRFPSYQTSFEIASNHVLLRSELTGDVVSDRRKILGALRDGQFYMSLDILTDPKGFVSYIEYQDQIYPLGSRIEFKKGMKLVVRLPEKPKTPFEVVVYKDGKAFKGSNSKDTEAFLPGPGVYRSIVRVIPTFPIPDGKKWMPWIYTNPFFIQ